MSADQNDENNKRISKDSYAHAGKASGDRNDQSADSFTARVWKAVSILALVVAIFWILKVGFNVVLLTLAGVLIALFFHGLAGLLQRKLKLKKKPALLISTIGSCLLLILFFWFTGSRIQQQAQELSETLPAAFSKAEEQINASSVGKEIMDRVTSEENMNKASAFLQGFFRSTFGVLGDIYVVFFLALFFTASPSTYVDGALKLVPSGGRGKAAEVKDKLGTALVKWLKGQLLSMTVVFVLTAIGLAILGIKLWLVLALIAGLLCFIPNFGPLIALIPGVLMGFMESPTKALLVLALYTLVQVLESNLITPQIQQKLISIPPAMIIISQLFMGVLAGGWGLILALPIVAILMVLVQELYVRQEDEKTSSDKKHVSEAS